MTSVKTRVPATLKDLQGAVQMSGLALEKGMWKQKILGSAGSGGQYFHSNPNTTPPAGLQKDFSLSPFPEHVSVYQRRGV